ncbi:MAG: ABC-type transport auxiliary lipoprotein family protein [Bacteroidota bacterium]|nr:ABC-type transport auxiliary lipoprotein family protein [Bacteroidota bacterium]
MKSYILTVFSVVFMLTSCMSEKNIIRKYYTLEIPPGVYTVGADTSWVIPGKCEIGRVNVNPVYEKNQIVNRNKSHEITYYMYHQWAVRPDDAIREMLSEYLQNRKLFDNVSTRFAMSIPDYRLKTMVNDLEIIENGKLFSAHVNLDYILTKNTSDSVLVRHRADRIEPLKHKDMNLFAREVSNILIEELEVFAEMLREKKEIFYSKEE